MREEYIQHTIAWIAGELRQRLPKHVPKIRLLIETKRVIDDKLVHLIGRMVDVNESI